MSNGEIERYIVTLSWRSTGLTALNELNNHLTLGGFLLTMTDDQGQVHDLGPAAYGFVSPLSEQEIGDLARGLGKAAIDEEPEVKVETWSHWLADRQG